MIGYTCFAILLILHAANSFPVYSRNPYYGHSGVPVSYRNGFINPGYISNTVSSIRYPEPPCEQEKEETLIHKSAPIFIKSPPTTVKINHPPLVVKPSPIVFYRPPRKVIRPAVVKQGPQRISVEPIFVNFLKPERKVLVDNNPPCQEQ